MSHGLQMVEKAVAMLVLAVISSSCKKAPDVSETRKVDLPKSVTSFFELHGEVQEAMQGLQAAVSEEPGQALKQTAERIENLVNKAKTVSIGELNAIYPQWGDHFAADFLPGLELLLRTAQDADKSYSVKASEHLREWDNWPYSHWDAILARLDEQYGVELRR